MWTEQWECGRALLSFQAGLVSMIRVQDGYLSFGVLTRHELLAVGSEIVVDVMVAEKWAPTAVYRGRGCGTPHCLISLMWWTVAREEHR